MLKMSPSARPRVATSSISVSLPATTFSRTTSSTGARPGLLNDDIGARHAGALVDDVLAEAAQARHGADEADLGERLLDGVLGHAQRGGDGQAADVVLQQRIQQLGHLAAQAFAVTGGRGGCAAFAAAPHAQQTTSSATIVLDIVPSQLPAFVGSGCRCSVRPVGRASCLSDRIHRKERT